MSLLFEQLQQTCTQAEPDFQAFLRLAQATQPGLEGIERVRSYALLRLAQAFQIWQSTGQGDLDVLVLLRQVLRSYERRLALPTALWQRLNQRGLPFGLRANRIGDSAMLELTADDWCTDWLAHTAEIDLLRKRRYDTPATGDGLLAAMSGGAFWQYQSQAQQIATHAALFLEPGATLLAMLPTGSGKSIIAQLPAWLDSHEKKGTTIVVVPTVALALDQELKAHTTFKGDSAPRSWTAQTPIEIRRQIIQELKTGDLPLLYVSPEALMQSSLYQTCLQAAEEGKLRRLVIDEAHLIESWGAGFRADFQFLATYRAELLARSRGLLQTLLLSATVSASCIQLLRQLFGSHGPFYEIMANRLRPEPSYWFSFSQYSSTRERRVLEALRYLPRPLILYVSTLDNASFWHQRLRGVGFQRIAAFTGRTADIDRQRLIEAWNNNEIDIMVATSAFGMGVDKSDVRCVLHACLPESLERFYQEVGRAGRDGYSSISLSCVTADDFGTAEGMLRSERITMEKALPRWEGMRQSQRFPDQSHGDVVLVDLNAVPDGSPDMPPGKSNLGWNEHTLLLMQRAGLLQITGVNQTIAEVGNESEPAIHPRYVQLKLLRPEVTAYVDNAELRERLEYVRNLERQEITDNLEQMQQVVRRYIDQAIQEGPQECLARKLTRLYPSCALACGGCPACRTAGQAPYERTVSVFFEDEIATSGELTLFYNLQQLLGQKATMNVTWESGESEMQVKSQLAPVLADLVWAGMRQLLLPDEFLADQQWTRQLVQLLAGHALAHQIIAHSEINQPTPLYPLPTVVVYPPHNDEADRFHRRLRSTLRNVRKLDMPLIHLVPRLLFLASEGGQFMERIEGKSETLKNLQQLLKRWQEPALF